VHFFKKVSLPFCMGQSWGSVLEQSHEFNKILYFFNTRLTPITLKMPLRAGGIFSFSDKGHEGVIAFKRGSYGLDKAEVEAGAFS
jgi:hypothetical protein